MHNGHIALARSALKELCLNAVYFVPAKRSPLKTGARPVSASHRVRMLKLAIAGEPGFRLSRAEIDRPAKTSYTIRTLGVFRKKFPGSDIFLLMGGDALADLKKWKNWKKILDICTVAAGARKGAGKKISGDLKKKAVWLKKGLPDISSTQIRVLIPSGRTLSGKVARKVAEYIENNRLYKNERQ